ncbi:phospholipase D/nuclease, partial [Wilcoxina mikolae CBS 423.85]
YPSGTVKKTWLENQDNGPNTIRIEGVLQKETLVTTLLSSFQWDYQWIMERLPLHKKDHNMIFVMQGKEEADRQMSKAIFDGLPRIELVFPPMDGQVNCMHSKLMLLFHKNGDREWLRIAVPTANLTDYDWGFMRGVMENMVFIIDLPKLKTPNPDQTFFLNELIHFCNEQTIPDSAINRLVYYDFSETKEMAFVHTIGGSHGGDAWKRTGYCGLGTAVKKLGYNSGEGLEIDYVTSSLGAAKEEFISNIYRAAQGHNGIAELQRRNKKPIKAAPPKGKKNPFSFKKAIENDADESTDDDSDFEEETKWSNVKERFRVFFPSKDTVVASKGGADCGGTICFQRKWWNEGTFPKTLVRDCKSVRPGVLMHNKLLFARPVKTLNSKNGQMAAWAYIGSANLSESAW